MPELPFSFLSLINLFMWNALVWIEFFWCSPFPLFLAPPDASVTFPLCKESEGPAGC